jgi:very-short-patch-repair endonuclease
MLINYRKNLKQNSKALRNHSTLSEVLLWREIKAKKLGVNFNRQRPINNYILDFFCPELFLAIEIDGASHNEKEKYDEKREKRLIESGIKVLHFSDNQVKKNLFGVVEEIKEYIKNNINK